MDYQGRNESGTSCARATDNEELNATVTTAAANGSFAETQRQMEYSDGQANIVIHDNVNVVKQSQN